MGLPRRSNRRGEGSECLDFVFSSAAAGSSTFKPLNPLTSSGGSGSASGSTSLGSSHLVSQQSSGCSGNLASEGTRFTPQHGWAPIAGARDRLSAQRVHPK
eukprot:CAMPEP_0181508446 /NCGR_PEP_ID=MMETSP1110-20121109/59739_1 /TAXON_ID=174948 /ORGANISM="Symbiodinium sp., Strain CCMP421" /LENGTH=100 /DNA_ID=CAMNT_0023637785 /DNA_START=288 /DNA_END=587 /DNA_ORIENTATION=-